MASGGSSSSCPWHEAVIGTAVARCPFLAAVAEREGPGFARAIAVDPLRPVHGTSGAVRRPLLEDVDSFSRSFALFHGPGGPVPLLRFSGAVQQEACNSSPAVASETSAPLQPELPAVQRPARSGLSHGPLPLATISLSGFSGGLPDFGAFLRALQHHTKPKVQHRRQGPAEPKPRPPLQPSGPPVQPSTSSSASAGQCPMRKILGPLAPVVFNPSGHLQCPEVIIRARAALAATAPVRELRPKGPLVKLLAVGATSAAVNVPCGMWREHCEKFSGHWFIAVHASIPFIAMLRKAVILPKYAILFTIATAIAGQAMGAKLERVRLQAGRPVRLTTRSAAGVGAAARLSLATPYPPAATSVPARPVIKLVHADMQGALTVSSGHAASFTVRHRKAAPALLPASCAHEASTAMHSSPSSAALQLPAPASVSVRV